MIRLVIVFVILTVVFAPAYAQQSIDPGPELEQLWDQVHAQPDDFSVACLPLVEGAIPTVHNADEPFPLVSVSKLLIFIEYARRVENGSITLSDTVNRFELNRYELARTDRGAHEEFMAQFPPGTHAINLWDIAATGMIQYSSNAASDYLLERLRPVDWSGLYQLLGLTHTGYPHPLNIIPLMMNNHDSGEPTLADVAALSTRQGEMLFERYLYDPVWRQEEIDYRSSQWHTFPNWNVQAAILEQHTVTGTTADFLTIMQAIYGEGGPLSATVKQLTRLALRWQDYPAIDNTYVEYGSKLGYYSGGMLTLVAYGQPHNGVPVISAIFFRDIPRRTYNWLLRDDAIGYLAHWMNLNACIGLTEAITPDPEEDEENGANGDNGGNGSNGGNGNGNGGWKFGN